MSLNTGTSGPGAIPRLDVNQLSPHRHGKASSAVITLYRCLLCLLVFWTIKYGREAWYVPAHRGLPPSPAGPCLGWPLWGIYGNSGLPQHAGKRPWAAALGTRLQACGRLALLELMVTEMCSKCGQRRSVGMKEEREVCNHAACPSLEYLPGQFAKHQPVSRMRVNNI